MRPIKASDLSLEECVVVRVRRGAAAEKAEVGCGANGVPCAGRDEDRVAGRDGRRFPIDFHFTSAALDEVKLLACAVLVALGAASGRQLRFGETLIGNRRVGAVENAADRRAILRGKWRLPFEVLDRHAELFTRGAA